MKQTRKKHSPSFKAAVRPRAEVALAALMGDQTIAVLTSRFEFEVDAILTPHVGHPTHLRNLPHPRIAPNLSSPP